MATFWIDKGKLYAKDLEPGSIEDSIKKWKFIAENYEDINGEGGSKTCALCLKYYENKCDGCPIYDFTGQKYCNDTPYCWFLDGPGELREEAALSEVEFLEEVQMSLEEQDD